MKQFNLKLSHSEYMLKLITKLEATATIKTARMDTVNENKNYK